MFHAELLVEIVAGGECSDIRHLQVEETSIREVTKCMRYILPHIQKMFKDTNQQNGIKCFAGEGRNLFSQGSRDSAGAPTLLNRMTVQRRWFKPSEFFEPLLLKHMEQGTISTAQVEDRMCRYKFFPQKTDGKFIFNTRSLRECKCLCFVF